MPVLGEQWRRLAGQARHCDHMAAPGYRCDEGIIAKAAERRDGEALEVVVGHLLVRKRQHMVLQPCGADIGHIAGASGFDRSTPLTLAPHACPEGVTDIIPTALHCGGASKGAVGTGLAWRRTACLPALPQRFEIQRSPKQMAKSNTAFVCQSCGASHAKWSGRCEACGAWNSLVEEAVSAPPGGLGAPRPARKSASPPWTSPRSTPTSLRRRASPPASPNSTACSAAAWRDLPPCSSAATPASASRRSSCRPSPRMAKAGVKSVYISGEEAITQIQGARPPPRRLPVAGPARRRDRPPLHHQGAQGRPARDGDHRLRCRPSGPTRWKPRPAPSRR